MSETASIRVNSSTRDALCKLALRRGETLTDTDDRAVKLLEQEAIGVDLDLGSPTGPGAGMRRPGVVVTAEKILRGGPNVVQVVPLTRTIRSSRSEVAIDPDAHNGLSTVSAAQCQHIRAVASTRIAERLGNVGPVALRQIRLALGIILDL